MKIQELESESFLEKSNIKLPKDCTLRKVIKVTNYFWLILNFPNYHEEQDTNIWCFNDQKKMIWKVERLDFSKKGVCPYVNVYEENGKIYADNWVGVDVQIDPETGKIMAKKERRPW